MLAVPKGARFLSVQTQNNEPQIWFWVDTEAEKEPYPVRVVGTGHQAPGYNQGIYRGTFQLDGGSLVFHVFTAIDSL